MASGSTGSHFSNMLQKTIFFDAQVEVERELMGKTNLTTDIDQESEGSLSIKLSLNYHNSVREQR